MGVDGGESDRAGAAAAELGNLTCTFVETVHAFYAGRAAREGALATRAGTVTVVQRGT